MVRYAAQMSRTTHGAPQAVDAFRNLAGLIVGAPQGAEKTALLGPRFAPSDVDWQSHPLNGQIDAIAAGRFKERQPPAIRGTGYVVHALEAVIWAFATTDSFTDGALRGMMIETKDPWLSLRAPTRVPMNQRRNARR